MNSRLIVRVVGGALAAALVGVTLSACSGGSGTHGCTPVVTSGAASQAVSAKGAFLHDPTVTFATPLHTSTTEVSTLIAGHGAPISAQQEIVTDLTVYDATTGTAIEKTGYTTIANAATFVVGKVLVKGLAKGLVCSQVGSRVAVVMPAKDGFPAGTRPTGVAATDSLVIVADIRDAYLARANGVNQVMGSNLPAVVLDHNGVPGITLPGGPPPARLEVDNLQDGSGATIKLGDTAVIQYTGVLWANGTVFDSTWLKDGPVTFPVKRATTPKGLVTAIVGQRIGSQVLVVAPPNAAYGTAGTTAIPPNSTLVYVVDILGKQ